MEAIIISGRDFATVGTLDFQNEAAFALTIGGTEMDKGVCVDDDRLGTGLGTVVLLLEPAATAATKAFFLSFSFLLFCSC